MPQYLARVARMPIVGDVVLNVIKDQDVVELHEGDEFVTITTSVPLFADEDDTE